MDPFVLGDLGFGPIGRTRLSLRALGLRYVRLPDLAACLAAFRDAHAKGRGAWILAEGAVATSCPEEPPASQTGKPVVAFGRCIDIEVACPSSAAASWDRVLRRTGGDLNGDIGDEFPVVASAWLAATALERVIGPLADGVPLPAALEGAVRRGDLRAVRIPGFDVRLAPAEPRVGQIVTTFQRGGAERIAIDLGTRSQYPSLLAALYQPTRDSFAVPETAVDLSSHEGSRADRIAELARHLVLFGADVVHTHLLVGEDTRALAAVVGPVVVTVHNAREGWPDGLAALEARDVSVFVACASSVAGDLRRHGPPGIPVRTIPNGVAFARPKAGARRTFRALCGWEEDDFVLVAIANPRPQKRLERLPEIVALCNERLGGRVRLAVAGAPSCTNPEAQTSADRLRHAALAFAPSSVRLLGAVDDIPGLLSAADALVSVSAYEGLSLAQLEAAALGVPVIATSVGGIKELQGETPGITLLPEDADPGSFAAAVIKLAEDPSPPRPTLPRRFRREEMAASHDALHAHLARAGRGEHGIVLVTNNFSVGGAQSSAARLLGELSRRGLPASAIVLEEEEAWPTRGRTQLVREGVPVDVVEAGDASAKAGDASAKAGDASAKAGDASAKAGDASAAAAAVLRHIERRVPRAVFLWNVRPEVKLRIASCLVTTPLFDISPGEMYFASLERVLSRGPVAGYRTPRDYGECLAGVVVKYAAERPRAEALGAPVHVVRNGVPSCRARPRRPRATRFVVGTSARIAPQKRLGDLVDAVRLAAPSIPALEVRIAGAVERGSEAHEKELVARAMGLPIEWCGDIVDIDRFLDDLDLFVMIAAPAGCPNASLEAMGRGLPVIITEHGGASEQVTSGENGLLVPHGKPEALALAFLDAASDRDRLDRWGEAGRRRAVSRFSVEAMVDAYVQLAGLTPG